MVPVWLTAAIAFIAPAFALAGVALGAWMQRKTTREQIEAQREKDRETWRREDRHRFVAEKRELYGQILTHYRESWMFAEDSEADIPDAFVGETIGSESRSTLTPLAFDIDFQNKSALIQEQTAKYIAHLHIIAPANVVTVISNQLSHLSITFAELSLGHARGRETRNLLEGGFHPMVVAMRQDLGIVDLGPSVSQSAR